MDEQEYQESINNLTREFIKSENNEIFEKLLIGIVPMINIQLRKNYSSIKEFWDDMRQDVFLKVWENRKNIKNSSTENPYQYFYGRIRKFLERSCKRIKYQYDMFNPNIDSQGNLDNYGIK